MAKVVSVGSVPRQNGSRPKLSSRPSLPGEWESFAKRAGYRVGALADLVPLSRRQLQRRITAATCLTPKQWLKALRLRKAKALLSHKPLRKEVAGELGFARSTNFSRAFRAETGYSPTTFLRRQTGQSNSTPT